MAANMNMSDDGTESAEAVPLIAQQHRQLGTRFTVAQALVSKPKSPSNLSMASQEDDDDQDMSSVMVEPAAAPEPDE